MYFDQPPLTSPRLASNSEVHSSDYRPVLHYVVEISRSAVDVLVE